MLNSALTQASRDTLRSTSNIVVFTYALAGLGHLRVTDALYQGLPLGTHPLAFGAKDTSLTFIHRITSIHPFARMVFEWTQYGIGEDIFTSVYRWYLRKNAELLYKQLKTLIDQRYNAPKNILIISTHFSLAHQLAEVKIRLSKEKDVNIYLVVQVTDDSPQEIWYVHGADLIIVPSYKTKTKLMNYGKKQYAISTKFMVNPYPVSPYLASNCSIDRLENRVRQLTQNAKRKIHVAIPISGAAVGLDFAAELMHHLYVENNRFMFHIISKKAPFTYDFLRKVGKRSYVSIYSSDKDKEVVQACEKLYHDETISLEVTKPSEQAFKALVSPRQNGGSLLLFTQPIGRQEYDNVDYLMRHNLIPNEEEKQRLFHFCSENIGFSKETDKILFKKAKSFRGIQISNNPNQAATFIAWGMRAGLFGQMVRCRVPNVIMSEHKDELGSDGVDRFWEYVTKEFLESY